MTNYYKVEQLTERSTTSKKMIDVEGTTLTFTPDNSSQIWMVFASGVCRSSSTSETSMDISLIVNDSEKDLWGHQNNSSNTPNGAGFFVFDRITGTSSQQIIKLQFRSNSGTCYVADVRILAVRVPNNADFQYYESTNVVQTAGSNTTIGSMSFVPLSSGNYYLFGHVCHKESPGGSTSQAWFEDVGEDLHPNAPSGVYHSNARDSWNPLTSVWRVNLPASIQTFNIKFTSSGSGSQSSQHIYRKLMAIREDAWDIAYYDISAGQSTTTSSSFQQKNSLTIAATSLPYDYISFQLARIGGDRSYSSRKAGELKIDGVSKIRTNHIIDRDDSDTQGYHHIVGLADARNGSDVVTYQNGYLSPNNITVSCAESVIVVLRYPSTTKKQTHQMML